jgi:NAD(P)-dependent dehydrogenase (short-subunit alcohol dehydrogenase family)
MTADRRYRRVKDKVVIVTGANSPLGIGRASAHLFARNGAKAIFICDFNTNHLETHKREINSLYPGVEIIPTKMDAGVEEDVERVVNDALAKFGRLDIFFANAGISVTMTNVLESNADDFMRVMRTNALR